MRWIQPKSQPARILDVKILVDHIGDSSVAFTVADQKNPMAYIGCVNLSLGEAKELAKKLNKLIGKIEDEIND